MKLLIKGITILSFTTITQIAAQDWPQWRGKERNGQAEGSLWEHHATPQQLWKVTVLPGLSSPVTSHGKAYLFARENEREVTSCFNLKNGHLIWQNGYSAPFYANSQATNPRFFPKSSGKGPFATPLLHKGALFVLGVSRMLSCFDADNGKLLWQKNFSPESIPDKPKFECPPCKRPCDKLVFDGPGNCPQCRMPLNASGLETTAKARGNYYGSACSPLFDAGRLFIHIKQSQHGELIAMKGNDGQEIWRCRTPIPASSSPIIAELGGVRQLITLTRESCLGIRVRDGAVLWQIPLVSNAQIITPMVFENLVLFAEYRGPLKAFRIHQQDNRWVTEPVWESTEHTLIASTPVLDGQHFFGFSSKKRGRYFSINAKTGKQIWTGQGGHGFHASIITLNNGYLGLSNRGELTKFTKTEAGVSLSQKFPISQNQTWAHPVVWHKHLLLRDTEHLSLWRLD